LREESIQEMSFAPMPEPILLGPKAVSIMFATRLSYTFLGSRMRHLLCHQALEENENLGSLRLWS